MSMCSLYICMYICIYIYIHLCTCGQRDGGILDVFDDADVHILAARFATG